MQIAEFVSDLFHISDEFNTPTDEQKKMLRDRFHYSLSTYVYYNDGGLLFSSTCMSISTVKAAVRSWMYYAGFEYINSEYVYRIETPDEAHVFFSADDDRVREVLDMLEGNEESEVDNIEKP